MDRKRMRGFEELVLLGVLAAGDDAYGLSVQKILAEELGKTPSLGAVYTTLDRLLQKGWVFSELVDPTPVRGGRRKRRYGLTEEGVARVAEMRRTRESLWNRATPRLGKGAATG